MNTTGNHLRIGPPWGLRPVEQMLDENPFLEVNEEPVRDEFGPAQALQ